MFLCVCVYVIERYRELSENESERKGVREWTQSCLKLRLLAVADDRFVSTSIS